MVHKVEAGLRERAAWVRAHFLETLTATGLVLILLPVLWLTFSAVTCLTLALLGLNSPDFGFSRLLWIPPILGLQMFLLVLIYDRRRGDRFRPKKEQTAIAMSLYGTGLGGFVLFVQLATFLSHWNPAGGYIP